MEENNKSGMTAEGRKLRPRKPRTAEYSSNSEHRSYGERKSYGSSNHSEHRSYGERKSYGSSNYGERKSYGSRSYGDNNGGERKSYGSRSYGDNNGEQRRSYGSSNYGERKSYGSRSYGDNNGEQRRSYGSSNYGERKSYGSRSHGDNNGEQRRSYGSSNYGERKSYGSSNYGERKSYGSRSYGDNNGGERKSYGSRSYGDRRPSGNRAGFGKRPNGRFNKFGNRNPYQFGEASEAGINQMIGKNPQIDAVAMNYSDNDTVATPIQEEVRLNKFIANSGVCSRREADQFIQAGVVTVNGEVVTELGTKVNVLTDDVRFNGERLKGEEKVYIVMNKPKGFVTSASDPHAEKTVMDLLKGCSMRVFPVGRLDKNTTGVLMFTNDGEIAERLTHPSYDKKKIYQVILDNALTQEDYEKIKSGITLNDGDIKADELEFIDAEDHRKLGIEIHSGKNRIVRRIFESLGYDVRALDRVYFAGLTKKGLQKGEWRYLSNGEVNILKMGAYV